MTDSTASQTPSGTNKYYIIKTGNGVALIMSLVHFSVYQNSTSVIC